MSVRPHPRSGYTLITMCPHAALPYHQSSASQHSPISLLPLTVPACCPFPQRLSACPLFLLVASSASAESSSSTILPLRLPTYAHPVREGSAVVKTPRWPLTAAGRLPEFPPADMGFPVYAASTTRAQVPLATRARNKNNKAKARELLGPLFWCSSPNTLSLPIPANAFPYLRPCYRQAACGSEVPCPALPCLRLPNSPA